MGKGSSSHREQARNARVLTQALARIEQHLQQAPGQPMPLLSGEQVPPALGQLAHSLGLSPFERDALLLAVAPQLDARIGPLLAQAQGEGGQPWLNGRLALALLAESRWEALTPVAPLRRWQLIELVGGLGPLDARWAVDETVLHALAGVRYADPRLAPWLQRQAARRGMESEAELGAQQDAGLAALAAAWEAAPSLLQTPVAHYAGREAEVLVHTLAQRLGLSLYRLQELPPSAEREAMTRLWAREALLHRGLLWVDLDAMEEGGASGGQLAVWLDGLPSLLLLSSRGEAGRLPLRRAQRLLPSTELSAERRLALWRDSLGQRDVSTELQRQMPALAEQFQLSQTQVLQLAGQWRAALDDHAGEDERARASRLWQAAREAAREAAGELLRPSTRTAPGMTAGSGGAGLDDLAQRIEARAQWADLVLPEPALHSLRSMAAQLRQRHRVYQSWGFAERSSRGLGLSALFSGGSGTGKTLAAEVLARELQLDLYRIDLASLVSKYIGETEKNLARVFAAAEASGAILLFDEADALFGKRSEVKDSHDRYANIEVSYLLQRVESYRGLAILTTNLKQAIDPAFQRRIRFIVQFPFPDEAARAAIWERAFPAAAPLGAIDIGKLMRLSLSGGHIRNLALNAAFLAADEDSVITMRHLRDAAAAEFAKLERPLPAADVGDWL
ncbi:ATP-binding protein [Paucibacter aquatile]|uniref:ATP-binding protein n=1 Tax=Kinneretia aquatilis TaxID=2070761 RepID=A0A2N8L1W1_9BURK|nr:ATP-binding protein [Paucibacter aquatile]